jgi:cellulose synthase/poly-beta-1,6-N-acetylglucosamine synthase-like glycosyltransferase
MWLSTVFILAISIYSVRSIIFIYVVTRANRLDKKRLHGNSSALCQRFHNLKESDHFHSSPADVSQNILPPINASLQPRDGLDALRQQNNNNNNKITTTTDLPSSEKDDKFLEQNEKKEDIAKIAKAAPNTPLTANMAVSLHEQCDIAGGSNGIEPLNAAAEQRSDDEYPFISILVATHNESLVIERLLKSLVALTYPTDRFEIMIVDDSSDDTYQKIQNMLAHFRNLKVIHRDNRAGWKGGALNIALEAIDKRASNVLVVDADSILLEDTLERFVSRFINKQSIYNQKGVPVLAIQGFPISKSNPEDDNQRCIEKKRGNWVARAIDFRLSQRNMIEFAAKDLLDLPLQITGSLFMIRADVIKFVKFSNDLCEDWDLTINLYCAQPTSTDISILGNSKTERISHRPVNSTCFPKRVRVSSRPKIIFDKELVSYCEATTDVAAYFRQRMRVSEGHTRGLRRGFRWIAGNKMLSLVDKVELFLNGLQYAKFISVLGIEIINMILILMFLSGGYSSQQLMNVFALSFSLQAANLAVALVRIILAVRICRAVRSYGIKDIVCLLALAAITTPAFVIGSLRGFFQDNGTFYRTRRNLAVEAKVTEPGVRSESSRSSSSPTEAAA